MTNYYYDLPNDIINLIDDKINDIYKEDHTIIMRDIVGVINNLYMDADYYESGDFEFYYGEAGYDLSWNDLSMMGISHIMDMEKFYYTEKKEKEIKDLQLKNIVKIISIYDDINFSVVDMMMFD